MRYYRRPVHPSVYNVLTAKPGLQQRTDEWLNARMKYITASEIASAVGENKYQSCEQYIDVKAGHAPRFTGNFATEWGTRYEPEAQALYEQRTGEVLLEVGLTQHPTIPWLAGSPDGITLSGRLLEIKCPLRRAIGDGTIPEHYMGQVRHATNTPLRFRLTNTWGVFRYNSSWRYSTSRCVTSCSTNPCTPRTLRWSSQL